MDSHNDQLNWFPELSMMNSHNKVISGMLFKTYTGTAEYEEDHHSYRCKFFTVPNHTYGHSPISTGSISRTISVLVVGVLRKEQCSL